MIARLLPPDRAAALMPFVRQYRDVRERDGYRRHDAAYYRALPSTSADDPQRDVWRIRGESYARLRALASTKTAQGRAVLDLGAGCGWLSHRFAADGWRAVAVDILDDDVDGLGAARHFDTSFECVQADFTDLDPHISGRRFDLIVFNGSLHYAPDPQRTLARAAELRTADGAVAVVDSPLFDEAADGDAMLQRRRAHFADVHDMADPVQPGAGYVLERWLSAAARSAGLRARFHESRGPVRWRADRALRALISGTRPPQFGVWWAA